MAKEQYQTAPYFQKKKIPALATFRVGLCNAGILFTAKILLPEKSISEQHPSCHRKGILMESRKTISKFYTEKHCIKP